MSPEFVAIVIVGLSNAAALAFVRALHCDISHLRERMVRIEGLFECFTQRGAPS